MKMLRPQHLAISVLGSATLTFLAACGSSSSSSPSSPPPATSANATASLDFTTSVNPILTASCAGAGCHGQGSPNGAFVDDQANFVAVGGQVMTRITATDPTLVMPPSGVPETLSATDRTTLETYLEQQGIPAPAAATPVVTQSATATGTSTGTATTTMASTGTSTATSTGSSLCSSVSAAAVTAGQAMTLTQFDQVLRNDCAGAGCHSTGSAQTPFVDNTADLQEQTVVAGMLVDVQNGTMPLGSTLSATDKAAIEGYICGHFSL